MSEHYMVWFGVSGLGRGWFVGGCDVPACAKAPPRISLRLGGLVGQVAACLGSCCIGSGWVESPCPDLSGRGRVGVLGAVRASEDVSWYGLSQLVR